MKNVTQNFQESYYELKKNPASFRVLRNEIKILFVSMGANFS